MIDMLEANPVASDEDILRAELILGVDLPEEYRRWLKTCCDGGFPSSQNHFIDRTKVAAAWTSIQAQQIYSLAESIEMRKLYSGRISSDLLPVVDDGCGNYTCLAICGMQREEVFFWDHERELLSAPVSGLPIDEHPCCFFVAHSWNAFIGLLGKSILSD